MTTRFYELIFIISLKKNTEEVKSDIHEILKYYDIKIINQESKESGIRKLAYPIKKEHNAYYYVLFVQMDPSCSKKLNHDIRLNESILRYLAFFKDVEKIQRKREKMQAMIAKAARSLDKKSEVSSEVSTVIAEAPEVLETSIKSDEPKVLLKENVEEVPSQAPNVEDVNSKITSELKENVKEKDIPES